MTATDSPPPNDSELAPIIGCIALPAGELPAPEILLADVARRQPEAEQASLGTSEHGSLLFHVNGNLLAISLSDGPLPWDDLRGPCATAWWWRDAEAQMQRHAAHLVVMGMGHEGTATTRHIDLTQMVCSVASQTEAIGIYWPAGTLVHEPHAFIDETEGIGEQRLPLHLWVDMRIETTGPDTHRFFSTGMHALERLELEVERTTMPPESLLEFCHSILHYMVVNQVDIEDGETVGRTEQEKVTVRRGDSMFPSRGQTLKLEMGSSN